MTVLPNLLLGEPIGDGEIAVTSVGDLRVQEAIAEQPRLGQFLSQFADQFGGTIDPSVIILGSAATISFFERSAIAGFRDLLAVATIPNARALQITHGGGMGAPTWSETFAVYPWMVDRTGADLVCQTPGMLGSHLVEEFHGQMEAGLVQCRLEPRQIDQPIFSELQLRWNRRFDGNEVAWEDRALFRSLNMAHAAMLMPGGQIYGFYDVGRLITLWISALEILLHPGPGGGIGEVQVLDVLDGFDWLNRDCAAQLSSVRAGRSTTLRTIAAELCHRMYGLRNDFLHGNDVSVEQLAINGVPFLLVASSLYRIVLAAFLGLRCPPYVDNSDEEELSRQMVARLDWQQAQRRHEGAIIRAAGV